MACAMNVSDTEMDSDATYCEEAENNDIDVENNDMDTETNTIDAKLDEIQNNICSHHLRKVFMTKPQMRAYSEFLTTILPHLDTQKQCLAKTYLTHLEQIAKIVEEFEQKWSSQQSLTQASDELFPCSLLTNQDFVSEQEQPTVNEEIPETDENAQFVESTENQKDEEENDEKKIFEAKLQKTIAMINEFKINFFKDLIAARQNPMPSVCSTTTTLVSDEFKLSPTTDAMNRATVFQIQKEANKWEMFNENKSEEKEK